MIIFMAGYPSSGKSFVVELISQKCPYVFVISPKDYRPDSYEKLDEQQKKDITIASWECSLNQLSKAFAKSNSEVIFYDTACACYERMSDYFIEAKKLGHEVGFVFVKSKLDICRERAGSSWLDEAIITKYRNSFMINTKKFRQISNWVMVVDNSIEPDLRPLLDKLDAHIDKTNYKTDSAPASQTDSKINNTDNQVYTDKTVTNNQQTACTTV